MFERINLQTEQQKTTTKNGFSLLGTEDTRERKTDPRASKKKKESGQFGQNYPKTLHQCRTSMSACDKTRGKNDFAGS